MKAYILTEDDLTSLLAAIDRDPRHGRNGGSSDVLSPEEEKAHDIAHRFYNYQVRVWMARIQK